METLGHGLILARSLLHISCNYVRTYLGLRVSDSCVTIRYASQNDDVVVATSTFCLQVTRTGRGKKRRKIAGCTDADIHLPVYSDDVARSVIYIIEMQRYRLIITTSKVIEEDAKEKRVRRLPVISITCNPRTIFEDAN